MVVKAKKKIFSYFQRGFTFVELVVATVIFAIAVTGIFSAIIIAIGHSSDPLITHQAVAIAESYLQEILVKNFPNSNPCPSSPGANRTVYANVCDYNGLSQVPTDQTNTPLAGLGNYNVVVNVDSTGTIGTLVAGTEAVRIDIIVTNPAFPGITISAYRTNY